MRKQPVVFVNKLTLREEGLEVNEFFVIFDIETEGKGGVNLINAYFSHQVKMVWEVAMLQEIIIKWGAR